MLDEVIAAGQHAGEKALGGAIRQKETGGVSPDLPAALAVFLASNSSDGITGRLISAVWDNWQGMVGRMSDIMSGDMYTLRRTSPRK
jgi:3-oxoacyl-[acyl-carrier protein] reductase